MCYHVLITCIWADFLVTWGSVSKDKTTGFFLAALVATKPDIFKEMLQQFPSVSAPAEPGKLRRDLFLTLTECFFCLSPIKP